jgi:hypothetical protein
MTGLRHVACLIASAAALVLSASGCTDYTYFNVHVTIDPKIDNDTQNNPRDNINDCWAYVYINGTSSEAQELRKLDGNPACSAYKTPLDVGTMDYSTARSSGTIKFIVTMMDANKIPTVQGSAQADVKVGQVLSVDLVAEQCPKTCDTCDPTCPEDTSTLGKK